MRRNLFFLYLNFITVFLKNQTIFYTCSLFVFFAIHCKFFHNFQSFQGSILKLYLETSPLYGLHPNFIQTELKAWNRYFITIPGFMTKCNDSLQIWNLRWSSIRALGSPMIGVPTNSVRENTKGKMPDRRYSPSQSEKERQERYCKGSLISVTSYSSASFAGWRTCILW